MHTVKRYLLALMLLSCVIIPLSAQNKTIHWLTFIDTTDRNVGVLDVVGRKVLYNRFINVINAALQEKGYTSKTYDYYDSRVSPENCVKAVRDFSCGSEDIVVFYYIGHGAHAANDNSDWPQLCLATDSTQHHRWVPLTWVHQQLTEKAKRMQARMNVTVGMCCNSKFPTSVKTGPSFNVNYGNSYLPASERKAIQEMFLNYKGDLLVCSAAKWQTSSGGSTPFGNMDLFTAALVYAFDEYTSKGTMNWRDLLARTGEIVSDATDGEQTPICSSNLTRTNQPTQRQSVPQPQVNSGDENINALTTIFDFLINTDVDEERRYNVGQEFLRELFSTSAMVYTLAQDVDQQIDRDPASTFIGRVSTSSIMLKVVPVRYDTDSNGRITRLYVREYLKK